MRRVSIAIIFVFFAVWGANLFPVHAGDSVYGKITEVRSADVVVLDYGEGQYVVRVVGIDVPQEGAVNRQSREFVSRLLLGKNARLRFEGRNDAGEMVGRLFTDDPEIGIKDVGLELVRSGLARKKPRYDYKYGELAKAEEEARRNRRGMWAQ